MRTEIFCDICAKLGAAASETCKMPIGWKTFKKRENEGYGDVNEIDVCKECLVKINERRSEAESQGWNNRR